MRTTLLGLAILVFGLEVARPPNAGEGDTLERAFHLVGDAVDRGEIPGAIALVARNGKILRHEAWGVRDIENKLPFTTNTLCWIASITKPVTATAAMTLVDSGKLALDDTVEKYLPEFRDQTDTNGTHHSITIRQLMSHTSGLVPNPPTRRSGWPIGGPLDDFWLEQKLPEIAQTIAQSQLRFKPGSKFEYSNSAFFVLGRIIEVVSGKSFASYVSEKILNPLGMNDTHYAPPPSATNRIAVIYARRDGQRETIFRHKPTLAIVNNAPDGGLFSYPAQFVPFLQMFLENNGRVLSRRAVTEMLIPQSHGWGLGWSLSDALFSHEGSSGTVAWADSVTGVIGILFMQYREQDKSDEHLRMQFRKAVRDAFTKPLAGEEIPIWPGAVAGDYGSIGPERVRASSEAPTQNAKWITNVKTPTITVFRPAQDKNTGTAVIVCPGGGYWNLAWDLEGEEVAAWLNKVGVTGVVLKYRVPRRQGQPERLPAPGPLLDAQRAVSLVRSRATEWGIDTNRIGILGFSAGGHLALATATHFDQRGYDPIDEIDKISCRPDFAVSVYPGYLIEQQRAGVEASKEVLASYIRIPQETPPIFLVHASDDSVAGAENSAVMYLALKRANVPAELHIFAQGGHGFGVRKTPLPCSTWTDRCAAWLQNQGMLRANTSEK